MATVTVYTTSTDGYITSEDAASPGIYADAREGTSTTTFTANTSATYISVGQAYATGAYGAVTYTCYEGFIQFDTSTLTNSHLVTAVTLSMVGNADWSVTDFITEARIHDWGAGLTTADYVAGSSLSGKTKVATFNSSGYSGSYNAFTSESAFLSNVNYSGTTYIVLCSKEQTDNSAPTTNEWIAWNSYDNAGNTSAPKLTLTYTSPVIKTITGVPKIGIKKVQQLA